MNKSLCKGVQFIIFLVALLSPHLSDAWFTPMHMDITRTAFEHLPADIQEVFAPYLDAILWKAVAPDLIIRDWSNHEWNIHRAPGDTTDAPTRIEQLFQDILHDLGQETPDIAKAADNLGLLSHYLADINQPMHTDDYANDNAWIHLTYEMDGYDHEEELSFSSCGVRLRSDIYNDVLNSARQANLYYQTIIDAYAKGDGYNDVRQITRLNYQRAVSDIVDVWTTLWMQATTKNPSLALQLNQPYFRPGDMMQLRLTALPGRLFARKADLYVAVMENDGTLWFMNPGEKLSREISPFRKSWILSQQNEQILFSAPVEGCDTAANFTVYAILVSADAAPSDPGSWMSNLGEVHVGIEPLPGALLEDIQDESYLFPATLKGSGKVVALPLQRWDFVFLGEKVDDPATPGDETLLNRLIPGNFRHILMYLGRDGLGRPCALELIVAKAPYLRVVRFPEFEPIYPSETIPDLPVRIEDIRAYQNRWAKRLGEDELVKLRAAEEGIFARIASDIKTDIPYQMEYNWSGDFSDMEIELIDDGVANGASCTDYLLSLLEVNAGVCIHGSRITAAELEEYFRSDALGSESTIPDEWNPFPFPVTVADVLGLGYHPVDPPPHIFPCDQSSETGVPIPAHLIDSPQLNDIDPVPLSPIYNDESWGLGVTDEKQNVN